jgi:DNA-binding NtrC family response regulator
MSSVSSKHILVAEERDRSSQYSYPALGPDYTADLAFTAEEAVSRLRQDSSKYAAVVLNLSRTQAVWETLRQIRIIDKTLPAIVLADAVSEISEAGCARLGYIKVLGAPVVAEDLYRALEDCIAPGKTGHLLTRAADCRHAAKDRWWTRIQSQIQQVGASEIPVLVQGETGTGKEVVARQLHACSSRANKIFLKVNCAALPAELVESELFGYERGAFTGAFKINAGKFGLADGGTVFLDEIGDMDCRLQAKLLQVLQDREYLQLGASEPRRVDVRVIAATHCDLDRMMAEGRFREDLYYRLNIVTIRVLPLRERKDEIIDLAHYFLRKHAPVTDTGIDVTNQLREALLDHDWPGNVRELENVMRKLLVIRRSDLIAEELRNRARLRKRKAEAMGTTNDARTAGVARLAGQV